MSKRTNQILELLTMEPRMEVALLAQRLDVSQVTVRKDLDELEHRGIILREHGYAVLRSMDDINGRIAYHYEGKQKIARQAATLVSNGDTVMVENGSCCALLAAELAAKCKEVTLITNSAFIAEYIRGQASIQSVLLGGIYQRDSQVLVGPLVKQTAANFRVPLLFIGTDGYSEGIGFTNRDQMRAQAVRDMARQAETVVILTESEKLSKCGVVPLNLKANRLLVITDDRVPNEIRQSMEGQGIEVVTA